MPKSLYEPAGVDQPEVCHCGHYGYIHGKLRCGKTAHPQHTWRGRLNWSFLGARFSIALRCPCRRGWFNGELVPEQDWHESF